MTLDDFIAYLQKSIKVDGKAGNLGDKVKLSKAGQKVEVAAIPPFSKRYLKYLTKKYLKKNEIREFLRVVATNKSNYELRYFNIQNDEESE